MRRIIRDGPKRFRRRPARGGPEYGHTQNMANDTFVYSPRRCMRLSTRYTEATLPQINEDWGDAEEVEPPGYHAPEYVWEAEEWGWLAHYYEPYEDDLMYDWLIDYDLDADLRDAA